MNEAKLSKTLVAVLQQRAKSSQGEAIRFLSADNEIGVGVSYKELDSKAKAIAASLQLTTQVGDRAILLFPTGVDYVAAFLGCLYAGVIAVPAYPPESSRSQHQQRLFSIIQDAQPTLLLTNSELREPLEQAIEAQSAGQSSGLPQLLCTDTILESQASAWHNPEINDSHIAFLQYTSGSTSLPKGVQVTHRNLIENEELIRQGFGIGSEDVIVSWLPLYHDMGLIGCLLQSIYSGVKCVLMSPRYFLERPVRWLKAISLHGGTISGGPDFAYRLCSERVSESDLQALDLSAWQVAFSGSEPIRDDTLKSFADRFSVCRFSEDRFFACYGLAEATLFVTGGVRNQGINTLRVDNDLLQQHTAKAGNGSVVVGCGVRQPSHDVRIIDPVSFDALENGQVGEIWVSGPSIAKGYWHNVEATQETFVEKGGVTWLRTGDLGFEQNGELFVTGRLKDMLIVRGQNLYPQDIERTVEEEVELVRKGRVAAYATTFEGAEGIGIAAEISKKLQKLVPPNVLCNVIREAVANVYQEVPQQVVLLNPGALPKTSSGKLQRSACRQGVLDGTMDCYAHFPELDQHSLKQVGQSDGSDVVQTKEHDRSQALSRGIAELWQELLKVDKALDSDHFQLSGGNSVLATQLVAQVRERFSVEVPLRTLFDAPTLGEFISEVQSLSDRVNQSVAKPSLIMNQPRDTGLPLSAAQARLWFQWQMDPRSVAYNIPAGLRLKGQLNLDALQKSLQYLYQRHESLRTRFDDRTGEVLQYIEPATELPIELLDLMQSPLEAREDLVQQQRELAAQTIFNLTEGHLLHVKLVRLAESDTLLLATLHHIIADGWSLNLMMDELSRLYAAAVNGESMSEVLAPLDIQYADYAVWQREWLSAGASESQLDYWKQQLNGALEQLSLPTKRLPESKSSQKYVADRLQLEVDSRLTASLRNLAHEHNVSLFMLLLAAFQMVLYRYTGQSDIRIGVPSANREHLGTHGVMGFFINTLVLRSDVQPTDCFADLLAQARKVTLDAQAHQDLPIDQLVEALGICEDGPLFQVMFNHQKLNYQGLRDSFGVAVEELPWHSREAKFELQLQSQEDEQGLLSLNFDYAVDLFDARVVEMFAQHFVAMLEQVVAAPRQRIAELPLISPTEQQQLLQWQESEISALPLVESLLPSELEIQALNTPCATALHFKGETLTYAELNEQTNRLAHYLMAQGVGPEVKVGILIERSFNLLTSILAVIKAGGAYVPLDVNYPAERLEYIANDSNLKIVLTDQPTLQKEAFSGLATLLDIFALEQLPLSDQPVTMPKASSALHSDTLAYVIYTSGSTGLPKGVGVSHGALMERLNWMRVEYGYGAQDVFLQKAPISFDVSVWECFLPLICGSSLVIAGPDDHRDPQKLVSLVQEFEITALHFVPPMLSLFINEPNVQECSSLRYMFSGGEALSPNLRDKVLIQLPNVTLHNRYGPTEAAINVTRWQCSTDDGGCSPIGTPLSNVVCRVLDGDMNSLPEGVMGELYVGGRSLNRGYISRSRISNGQACFGWAAMTAERFVPDPYAGRGAQASGARLYRTGDLANCDKGALSYLGRVDQQIKLRGFRIELQEIEAHLLSSAIVDQVALQLYSGTAALPMPEQLVAYYVPVQELRGVEQSVAVTAQLKQELAKSLPDYMIPTLFVPLVNMPLTVAGKVDYRSLPTPDMKSDSRARIFVAPTTELQCQVAGIWQEVLGRSEVSLQDDFFELGGHSLLATQIVSRVRLACDVNLPLKALFDHSRLDAFVEQICFAKEQGRANDMTSIALIDRSQPVPLSYSQKRYWFLWQMEPNSPAYNVGGMARLRGDMQEHHFESAFRAVISRHEALRTTFPSIDGVPVQNVAPEVDVPFARVDFSSLSEAVAQAKLQKLADSEANQAFNLADGPLLRACLVKMSEREHYFVLTLHHIVTEGWAMDIFARELSEYYAALVEGRAPSIAPLTVQYLDYSVWHDQWLKSGEQQRQEDYWIAQLGDDQPVLELPSDRPRPPVQSYRGGLYRFDLTSEQAVQINLFNAENGLTQFMTMTSALALMLYRYSGQNDLRIGAPVANRIRPESEDLIGAFLNTQVLRCQLNGQMSVQELIEQVRTTVIEGQSHQDLPFDQLVDVLQPPRSTAYNPLFQVMCNVQRWDFQQSRELAGLSVDYIVNDAHATKFDLNLEVTDLDNQLSCCLTYSKDLFDESRIAAMAAHWRHLLMAMIRDPQQKLSELALFSDEEHNERLSSLWPIHQEVLTREQPLCLHELFELRVRAAPDAPALTFNDQTLSYTELNRRANQLAHWLCERGVGPEVSVGLAMERSLDMVIGLLGILKAGGVYVPLDPEYPLERLRGMIDDSDIHVLLSHQNLLDVLNELPNNMIVWSVERDTPTLDDYPETAPKISVHPDNQAYLIYTSGSTGTPKGVMVSHREIVRHCQAVIDCFGMRSDDCELHFYSINFDAASERLLAPLLCGGRVVLRAQGQWDAQEICQIIREQSVTILGFTPSYGSQLAQWLVSQNETLPVRMCITGGEALTGEHLQRVREAFQPEHFFNAYGPTETVVMPMACAAPQYIDERVNSVPIGDVVGARVAYILDDDLALLPQGSVGELYVGGLGVARGYRQRGALNAERFVPDPFTGQVIRKLSGGRLYRTGDLVRQLKSGQVEYVGRSDYQVKVRGFRIELGEIEARMLEHPEINEAIVTAVEHAAGKQLVGYASTISAWAEELNEEQKSQRYAALRESLKVQLKDQLPDYMVPAHFILLDKLPLSPNGKVDRRALPEPDLMANREAYAAPTNEWEQLLADIWQDVLGVTKVGIHDNFFELGGDSILSIQVVSRARQLGIHFTPRELFQHQTVQTLIATARLGSDPDTESNALTKFTADQGLIEGRSLLTPIQYWFKELAVPNRAHWNQSILLAPSEQLDADLLEQAIKQVIQHHDALRLRFEGVSEGTEWNAVHGVLDDTEDCFENVSLPSSEQELEYFESLQKGLDLQRGPLLKIALVSTPKQVQRLLLVAHHLVVDGVSWRILLGDLQQAYRQLKEHKTVQLPPKTSAFRDWADRLHQFAKGESAREALPWWQSQLGRVEDCAPLPFDYPSGDNLECYGESVRVTLSADKTQQLLQQAPAAYRTQVNDLLLTALTRVLCQWNNSESVIIQLEGHGREELFSDIDLTRTVGWFTSAYPLRFTPTTMGSEEEQLESTLKLIKEQLRSVPQRGLSYGVLRYLADNNTQVAMSNLPVAQVTFNYLGQIDQSLGDKALFKSLSGPTGGNHDEQAELPNALSIDGQVSNGQLELRWAFSCARFDKETVSDLAKAYVEELQNVIAHCLVGAEERRVKGVTPSDFPMAKLSQQQLDALAITPSDIEDIYPLTPMQEGLLLHTLLEPGTGIYFMQDRYRINSAIDPQLFAEAWGMVVARHEALRASFTWNAGEAMRQIIHKAGPVKVDYLDWSDENERVNEARLQSLLQAEREAGFDLLHEPPFQLRLIRVAEQGYWFIMSNHHILIDAWCRSLLMNDFFEIYMALTQHKTVQLSEPPRYRDYIAWLLQRDQQQALKWWQNNLQGFEQATAIASDRPLLREHAGNSGGMIVGDCFTQLTEQESFKLQQLAQTHQLTLNTFAQAAWALVLRRLSGDRDVLFGVTVAGRPIDLPEMQHTVGLFINSIPLRIPAPKFGDSCTVGEWLQSILQRNLELREYEYLPLVDIQQCSELPQGDPLFDTLFVFENAPVDSKVLENASHFNASSDTGRTHTNFPLTAVCYPGDALGLHISYDQRFFDGTTIESMLEQFKRLLLALGESFDQQMSDFPLLSHEEVNFLVQTCNQTENTLLGLDLDSGFKGYIERFEEQVRLHPERIVASCLDECWSYQELNNKANKLAFQLSKNSAYTNAPIALLAPRGLNLLGMMVGTFKARGAYLPLDPEHPIQRMADMLSRSHVSAIVCDQSCEEIALELLNYLSCSDRPKLLVWQDIQDWNDTIRLPSAGLQSRPDDLSYVIYTSGSTGVPKGVMVEQLGMLNNQLSKVPYFELTDQDVIAQTASQCFDISVWQFLAAPIFGARVDIVPNIVAQDPRALLAHIESQGITVLESVPSLIQGMLDDQNGSIGSLRWLLPTGEAMPPALAQQWLNVHPDIGLVNAYGPAECSDDVALFSVDLKATQASYLPIGSPTDNNRLYLLDEELSLVPQGAVAELCVSGIGVGRGYLNDPKRTAQVFVPNPFSSEGERLYRTGDLAKRRSDGVLAYVGRIDQQVKIRGFRIELGEIEANLNSLSEVSEAAVSVQQGSTGKYLVAYLTMEKQTEPKDVIIERLKSTLRGVLPEYMVPLHWSVLESMPRNANGKLDRKALPAIDIGQQLREHYLAPRSELEEVLASIWSELLKVDQVGVYDNFFELGGHSLIATQIASRVQAELQRNVPLRAMFECSTVADLAEYIDSLEQHDLSQEKVDKLDDLMSMLEDS